MKEKSSEYSLSELRKEAADLLAQTIARGVSLATESLLEKFPQLASDRESVLELIYLEWIVRQERGEACSFEDYSARFPEYRADLGKLLEVDDALRDAMGEEPLSGSKRGRLSGASLLDTWTDGNPVIPSGVAQIGDYALQGIVGRGGMGIVYRAKQCRLDRLVALKTLDLIGSLNPQSVVRFREEAELVARLQHPNIVQVFETGSHKGIPYYSMEFVEGGNLAAWLRNQKLKPAQSAKLVEVLARAIHYAHLEGIIHRDLKPANVLLARSSRAEALDLGGGAQDGEGRLRFEPKIVDFGLAKLLGDTSRQTLTGTAIGTPSYMPPEQLDPGLGEVGPACDVYSLGAILYELLMGEPPFHGPTALETMRQVRHEEVVFSRSLRQRVSSDLLLICQTCLRKEPNQRYASASDLADDLHRYLEGKPILARRATLYRRGSKWARRHPSATALLVMTALIGMGTAGLWWRAEVKGRVEREQRVHGEHMIYARNIALAEFEFKANKAENCEKLLEECQPSLRNWEWHYLRRQCQDALWESPPSAVPTVVVALSPDGGRVASGHAEWGTDRSQPIAVWDVASGDHVWSLMGHPGGVYDLAFSPDGQFLASAGVEWEGDYAGSVQVWSMADGKARKLANENAHVVRFHPDGTSLYVGFSTGILREYSLSTGKVIGTLNGLKGFVTDLAFDEGGQHVVATSRDGSLVVWDRATRKAVDGLYDLGDLRRVAWHPDGKTLLVSGYMGLLSTYEWKESRLRRVHTQSHSSVPIVRYSPDGLSLAMAVFGEGARLVDSRTGRVDRVLRRHNGHVNGLSFDATGMRLATGGNDGAVRVWDLTRSSSVVTMDTSRREKISLLESNPAKPELALAIPGGSNKAFPSSPSRIELLDLTTRKVRKVLRERVGGVTSMAYSPSGNRMLVGHEKGLIELWDMELGKSLSLFSDDAGGLELGEKDIDTAVSEREQKVDGGGVGIVGLAFLGEDRAIGVDEQGRVVVWEVGTRRVVGRWSGSTTRVRRMSIDGRGTHLAILDDQDMATLWEIGSTKEVGRRRLSASVVEMKLGPWGRQIAIGDASGRIELWDRSRFLEGEGVSPTAILSSHTSSITSLSYNRAGDRLISCSSDESMRLIDAEAGCEVFEMDRAKGRAPMAIFSHDEQWITRAEGANLWHWNAGSWDEERDFGSGADLAGWYRGQIDRATAQRAWRIADGYRTKLIAFQPENEDLYHWRGVVRIRLNDLEGAESDLRKALELRSSLRSQHELARVLLLRGKAEEYREVCQKLLSETLAALRRNENYLFAWVSCLSPESGIDPKVLRTLLDGSKLVNNPVGALLKAVPGLESGLEIPGAEKSVKDFENSKEFDSGIYSLVCYRCGEYALAIKHAQEAAQRDPLGAHLPNVIRAMCLMRTGKVTEAKRVLAVAKSQRNRVVGLEASGVEISGKILGWNEVEYPILVKEAERTLADVEAK